MARQVTQEQRMKLIQLSYIARLKDTGERKVLLLSIKDELSSRDIAKILKIKESTVDKILYKGSIKLKRMMYKDLDKRKVLIN